jgi:transcriptional regulator with XRE-family HTH domain
VNRLLRYLGPALRLMRLRRGMRQYDLAGRAQITKAMLSAYENRRRVPSLRTLSKLLDALDARLLDLVRIATLAEA